MAKKFHSGFVSLLGRPNVGKSTLMNKLIGEKIAIVSNKPQTTRNKIQCILTTDEFQAVFIDTPGIHAPKHKLGQYMVKAAESSMRDVDIILMLTEPKEEVPEIDEYIIERFKTQKAPVILVINKIDTVDKGKLLKTIEKYKKIYEFKEYVPISSLKGENIDLLLNVIKKYLPEGPMYFPDTMITDQPERQIISEIIREKILRCLNEEIPHGTAVEITHMRKRDDSDIIDIEATIFCEKDSHKGIIIGKQGSVLKKIGTWARADIEGLLGSHTNLKLWVKVKKDWRDNDFLLKNFGYDKKNI
ncbi:MAG: GTPase Era [Lachnospiraceae bacterium]|nr:GTPase Era [Lachnospiraceae bacterium]